MEFRIQITVLFLLSIVFLWIGNSVVESTNLTGIREDEYSNNNTHPGNLTTDIDNFEPNIESISHELIKPIEEDDMALWNGKAWLHRKLVKGYLVVSNDLQFMIRILDKRKVIRIRIPIGSARITETTMSRRDIEIKTSTWNKIRRVKIRVPFGFQPQELKVIERVNCIDIYAPYDFIEFPQEETQADPSNVTTGKLV